MTARDTGLTVKTMGGGSQVTLSDCHKMPFKGYGYVSMDVGKGSTGAHIVLHETMLVPDLTDNHLSVRSVDRRGGAVVLVGVA